MLISLEQPSKFNYNENKNINDDTMMAVQRFERVIAEGDVVFVPNPTLTKIRCMFKHKCCKLEPSYTDGKNNYYCDTHGIMIQWERFQ